MIPVNAGSQKFCGKQILSCVNNKFEEKPSRRIEKMQVK